MPGDSVEEDLQILGLHQQKPPPVTGTYDDLRERLERIQALLWLDTDYLGDYWNADKDWPIETLDWIVEHAMQGLVPQYGDYNLPPVSAGSTDAEVPPTHKEVG